MDWKPWNDGLIKGTNISLIEDKMKMLRRSLIHIDLVNFMVRQKEVELGPLSAKL